MSDLHRLGVAVGGAMLAVIALLAAVGQMAHASAGPPDPPTVAAPRATAMRVDQRGPDATLAGRVISYVIWFTNTSTTVITGVEIQDTWNTDMPQATSATSPWWERGIIARYESYTASPPDAIAAFTHTLDMTTRSGAATWWLRPISAGESVRIIFSVTVPITLQPALSTQYPWGAVGPSRLGNSVVAVAAGYDNAEAAPVQTSVVGPLLKLTKSVAAETAPEGTCRVGKRLTFTIAIQNVTADGNVDRPDKWGAAHLVVTEELPLPLRGHVITVTADEPGVAMGYSSRYVTWTFPADFVLMPSQGTTVTFVARLPYTTSYSPNDTYLTNEKTAVVARADGMPLYPANAEAQVRLLIISPFDKVVEAPSPPPDPTHAFPGRVITYTLTFYNPLQRAIEESDYLIIEDDLYPGFVLSDVIAGAQPAAKTATHLEWEYVTVPENGVLTSTFRVTLPTQILPNTCAGFVEYGNSVTATFGQAGMSSFVGHHKNSLAPVYIEPEIVLAKSVEPSVQLYGNLVTYTVMLQNVGDRDVPGPFVVTDVLPLEDGTSGLFAFTYYDMVNAALPPGDPISVAMTSEGQVVVWLVTPTIRAGETFSFAFRAVADGLIGKSYGNTLLASNDHTAMCPLNNQASVRIDSPFRINKEPLTTTVVQSETFQYHASISHVADRGIFTLTRFLDDLSPNLFVDATGSATYRYTPTTPFELTPGGIWEHTFDVIAAGDGLGSEWCNKLAYDDKLAQEKGTVQFVISDSATVAYTHVNASALAEITVLPHVSLLQEATPNPVAVSQTMTLSLILRDNRHATSDTPLPDVTGITLTWTLPHFLDKTFVFITSTIPPDEVSDYLYTWRDLTLPAGDELRIDILLEAPQLDGVDTSSTLRSEAAVIDLDDPNICIPAATGYTGGYRINVVKPGIRLSKTPSPNEVGPYGEVVYTLRAENRTGLPVHNVIITDVLPPDWHFLEMVDGPDPISTDPPVWAFAEIPATSWTQVRFKARAYVRFRTEINTLMWSAPITTDYAGSYTNTVGVTVRPGIGFFKDVAPRTVNADESVVYTITLYNAETFPLSGIFITDTLPPGFTYSETLQGPDAFYNPGVNPQLVKWSVADKLDSNDALYIVFRAHVARDAFTGDYLNEAEVFARDNSTGKPVTIPPTGPTARVHVNGIPAVRVTKIAVPAVITAGESAVYTLTLSGDADQSYTLIVTDTLPDGFAYADMLLGPAPSLISGTLLSWQGLTLGVSETVTLAFRVRASRLLPDGTYCNAQVQVKMGDFRPRSYTPDACVQVNQLPRVDAQITKRDGRLWVAAGETLTYTLYYTNASDMALTGVVLTESVAPVTWVTVLPAEGWTPLGAGLYRREVGTLAARASGTVTFAVRLAHTLPVTPTPLRNEVRIGYTPLTNAVEVATANNVASDLDLLPALDKQVTPATALAGAEVVYTLTLRNTDAVTWEAIQITDTLPVSFTYRRQIEGSVTPQVGLADGREQLRWSVAEALPAGAELRFVLVAQPVISAPTMEAVNGAVARVRRVGTGASLLVPGAEAQVQVLPFPLASKAVTPTAIVAGEEVTYTIVLTNSAAQTYTVQVTDTLPLSFTFAAMVSGPAPDVAGEGRAVAWSALTLPPSQTTWLRFRARAMPSAEGHACNAVSLAAGGVTRTWSSLACVAVTATSYADLRVTKDDGVETVQPGETLRYTVRYTNASALPVAHLVLTDTFAPASAVASVEAPAWNQAATGLYTVAVGPLNAGASGSLTLAVRLADMLPPAVTRFTNTVEIAPLAMAEGSPADNVAADVDTVLHPVTLTVAKIVSPAVVEAGGSVVYTITLANPTTQMFILPVTDTLPLSFTYVDRLIGPAPTTHILPDGREAIVWEGVIVGPEQEVRLVFRATVAPQAVDSVACNDVDVGGAVPRTLRDVACVQIGSGVAQVDAQITKSDGVAWAHAGEALTYTLRYTNASDVALTGVVLTESVTPTAYVTVLPLEGWTQTGEGLYRREVGTLAARASGAVTFAVRLAGNLPTTTLSLINRAGIAHTTAGVEELERANDVAVDVDGVYGPDLVVKGVRLEPTTLISGRPYTVYVRIANVGNAPAVRWDGGDWWGWVFVSGVYLTPEGGTPPTGVFDHNGEVCTAWGVQLAPGAETESVCPTAGGPLLAPSAGRYALYVQADVSWSGEPPWGQPFGLVQEAVEENNLLGPLPVQIVVPFYHVYLPLILRQ